MIDLLSRNYAAASLSIDEFVTLADEKNALFWKVAGSLCRGWLFALNGRASDAAPMISTGVVAWRSMGAKMFLPLWLSCLSRAYAGVGQLDLAWQSIEEALTVVQTTGERWVEAEIHLTAGEIALVGPQPDAAKAEEYFERALVVARQQQAKSWEIRAATSMARLWRDQGKPVEARDLLGRAYRWFTEGFETPLLKDAQALLEELNEHNGVPVGRAGSTKTKTRRDRSN